MNKLEIFLSVLMSILYSASIQSYDKSISVSLKNIDYSTFSISIMLLGKFLGYFLAPFFIEKLLRKFGIFKTYIGSIVIFCEASLLLSLFAFDNVKIFFFFLLLLGFCVNLNLLNIVTIFSSTSFGSDLIVLTNAISNFISVSLLKIQDIQRRSIVIFGMASGSIIPFLMRDLSKTSEIQVKGNPSLSKAYFKYNKYFWSAVFLNLSAGMLRQFLPFVLIEYSKNSMVQESNIVINGIIVSLGEILSIPLKRLAKNITPINKIVMNCFAIMFLSVGLLVTISKQNFIFKICLFIISGLLSSRRFNIDLFMTMKQPEDFDISIFLTDNQIRQVSNLVLLLLGSQIIDFFPFKGLFISIIVMQFFTLFKFVF